MFGLGAGELLIILVFALLFIGPKKLPELAKSLGKGLREFQRAKDDLMDHINNPEIENHDKTQQIAEAKTEETKSEEVLADASNSDNEAHSEKVDSKNQEKNI